MNLPSFFITTSAIAVLAMFAACSSDNGGEAKDEPTKDGPEQNPSQEERKEEHEYIEDRLLREFIPPNKSRWYEYDERTVRVFGAGCTDAYCHHYVIHTDSNRRIIDCIYSNDYYCRDFIKEDGTFTDLRTIKVYGCDSIEPIEGLDPYKITHIYDEDGNVIGHDTESIELFNARDRFKI